MLRALGKLTVVATVALVSPPADAVILLQSETRNTTPPSDALAASGWQYQAQFADFLGTPISPKYFLTAQHIGGSLGQDLHYNGQTYFTDQKIDVPNTDLRLWRISGTFPSYAPLFDPSVDGSEVGRPLVVFGRGTQRGAPVYTANGVLLPGPTPPTPSQDAGVVLARAANPANELLRGWRWGAVDGVQSWGQNAVTEVVDDPEVGKLLYFTFDRTGGPNEAALSTGDSGGGVFIESRGVWKLAGINSAVDGPFALSPYEAPFFAALFDVAGLYFGDPAMPIASAGGQPVSAGAYASAVSASLPFILSKINSPASDSIPEPTSLLATIAAGGVIARRPVRR